MIRSDCRYYVGAKPCAPHKHNGQLCDTCIVYAPIRKKILIIKLGAMGDVLRTTAILHKLVQPDTEITWVTKAISAPLLVTPMIDRVLVVEEAWRLMPVLLLEQFDVIYSLDNDVEGANLGELARSEKKFGYGTRQGKVYSYTDAAKAWLDVSVNDDLKKRNVRTYQDVLFEICELCFDADTDRIVLPNTWQTATISEITSQLHTDKKIVGVAVGAGGRWPEKSLSMTKLHELLTILVNNHLQVLLIGGTEEINRFKEIHTWDLPVVFSGTENTVAQTIALLAVCDFVVTGDTLPMHMSVGLGKRTYTYLGPTSAVELADYGVMTKLLPTMTCLCCYLTQCDKPVKCNDSVSFDLLIQQEGLHI